MNTLHKQALKIILEKRTRISEYDLRIVFISDTAKKNFLRFCRDKGWIRMRQDYYGIFDMVIEKEEEMKECLK